MIPLLLIAGLCAWFGVAVIAAVIFGRMIALRDAHETPRPAEVTSDASR